jgi:hypothetical protein
VKEVFPKATITSARHRCYPNRVVINLGTEKQHTEVVSVPQRDLYSKYRHPAKPTIVKALKALTTK